MISRINVDASLWNVYCFTGTWGYTFKPTTRKMTKRVFFMRDLLVFSSRSFSYEFGNLLYYFCKNDLSFFPLLIKLFEHFNLSILRISSHLSKSFSWIPKMWWCSLLFYVGQMRYQSFHWVEDLVAVFCF